jgi:hypothetical protein
MAGESLVSDVPSGSVIRTGGSTLSARGGSRNAARAFISPGKCLLEALTTAPVSVSSSAKPRSPSTPWPVMQASSSRSPPMDLTGNRQSSATTPTGPDVVIRSAP